MCGRTALTLNQEQVKCACSYKERNKNTFTKPNWINEHNDGKEYKPSPNIAPTDVTPVLVSGIKFQNATEYERVLKPMMWGIIPPWHKGHYKTNNLSTNNCRLENIQSSKLYGPILNDGGRCIIVVEGFYEWQTTGKQTKVKQPYYIYSPQDKGVKIDDSNTWSNKFSEDNGWQGVKLLYMAGLYNVWQDNGTIIYAYSVITMESNDTLNWLHHRMPAILDSEEQISAWLDTDRVGPKMAINYLKPIKLLSWHPVSSLVNNSKNKSQACNKQSAENNNKNSQKTLTEWFTKATTKKKSSEPESEEAKKMKM